MGELLHNQPHSFCGELYSGRQLNWAIVTENHFSTNLLSWLDFGFSAIMLVFHRRCVNELGTEEEEDHNLYNVHPVVAVNHRLR